MHAWLLIKDAWLTKNWKDKLRIWIMPTGWRPADVIDKYPVYKISDVYDFEKYNPKSSTSMSIWCWLQLSMMLLLISYLFGNIAAINAINSYHIYVYGAFVFIGVYAYAELMDRNLYAIVWESIKNVFGISIIYNQGDWFGSSQYGEWIKYSLIAYFITSTFITGVFVYRHWKEDKMIPAAA